MTPELHTLLNDILIFIIGAGWLMLLGTGLEPDRPLSGGIPGHVNLSHAGEEQTESLGDRLGELAGWIAFGSLSVLLIFILIWILRAHS